MHRVTKAFDPGGVVAWVPKKTGPKDARVGAAREAAIRRLHDEGRSLVAIAAHCKVSRGTVSNSLKLICIIRNQPPEQPVLPLVLAQPPIESPSPLSTVMVAAETTGELADGLPEASGLVTPSPATASVEVVQTTLDLDPDGWSPALFARMVADDFEFMTYRTGKIDPVAAEPFTCYDVQRATRQEVFQLADTEVELGSAGVKARQVTRLQPNGHQTHIVTSRRDLSAVEVATRMFDRWRQENFLKYMRQEYAIDAPSKPAPQSAPRYGPQHRRAQTETTYPSTLTDLEWSVLGPLLVKAERRGRPSTHDKRAFLNAVFYQLRAGNPWRYLPNDFPPWPTVWSFFRRLRDSGGLEPLLDALRDLWRQVAGRSVSPSAGIVDSQTVKTTEKGAFADTTPARRSKDESVTWSSTSKAYQ